MGATLGTARARTSGRTSDSISGCGRSEEADADPRRDGEAGEQPEQRDRDVVPVLRIAELLQQARTRRPAAAGSQPVSRPDRGAPGAGSAIGRLPIDLRAAAAVMWANRDVVRQLGPGDDT